MPDEHVDVDMKRVMLELARWMIVVSTVVAVGWFLCERYRATHAILAEGESETAPEGGPSANGSLADAAPMPEDLAERPEDRGAA